MQAGGGGKPSEVASFQKIQPSFMLKAPQPPRGICPQDVPCHLMKGLEEKKAVGGNVIHVFDGHHASSWKLETTGTVARGKL